MAFEQVKEEIEAHGMANTMAWPNCQFFFGLFAATVYSSCSRLLAARRTVHYYLAFARYLREMEGGGARSGQIHHCWPCLLTLPRAAKAWQKRSGIRVHRPKTVSDVLSCRKGPLTPNPQIVLVRRIS